MKPMLKILSALVAVAITWAIVHKALDLALMPRYCDAGHHSYESHRIYCNACGAPRPTPGDR